VDAALAAVPTTVGDAAAPAPDRVENPLPIVKAPIVALEDWPASDDFLLREAVEAGAALGAIARGILPFSTPRTREDITERWRALLYNETVSLPAARRMAQYALDAKPRVAPLPTTIEFKDAFVNGNGKGTTEGDEMDSSEGKTGGDTTDTTHTNDKTGNRDTKVTTGLVSIPPFALAEAAVFDMPLLPSFAQVDFSAKRKSKQALQGALAKIRKLEASAQAATARNATSVGAVGVLQGNNHRFFLKKRETAVGRNTEDQRVDVDMCLEGNASKVSRQQCFIKLRWNGTFCLRNVGRRPVWINGFAVESGKRAKLNSHSLIEVGGMRLLFLPNPAAVRAADPEPF